ncbi:hypothetical protein HDU91_005217 [Kappamyces sp. JEL0680]|nr:hypothetical protein HDU91_005217 [Kappamyces sp. JEL0680]
MLELTNATTLESNATAAGQTTAAVPRAPSTYAAASTETPYLWPIGMWMQLAGGLLGFLGSVWILYQYHRRRILRNTPGLLIAIIAYLDIVFVIYYYFSSTALGLLEMDRMKTLQLEVVFQSIFDGTAVTYCALSVLLSFNMLWIVRYNGTSSKLDQWRWPSVIICFLSPIPLFYIPEYIWRTQPFFQTVRQCSAYYGYPNCQPMPGYILMTTIIIISIVTCIVAYLTVWWTLRNRSARVSNSGSTGTSTRSAIVVMKRLTMVYSLTIIVMWVPFLVRYMLVNIFNVFAGDDYFMGHVSVGTIAIWVKDIMTPMRGYIHAQAVLYVYKVVSDAESRKWTVRRVLEHLLLLTPIEPKADDSSTAEGLDTEQTVEAPDWSMPTVQKDFMISVPETVLAPESQIITQNSNTFRNSQILVPDEGTSDVTTPTDIIL